jgi:PAS domain S-box-containing protein
MNMLKSVWLLLVAIPSAVLIGWISSNTYLKSVVPGLTPMSPVSLCCFLLIAIGFAISVYRPKLAPTYNRIVGTFLVAMGLLIIIRTIFGFDSKIDQVLFHDRLAGNRVAPNTAFNFVLIGIILNLYGQFKRFGRVLYGLLIINAFISILSILGYAFGLKELFGISHFIPMAIHTATCFLLTDVLIGAIYFNFQTKYINKRIAISLLFAAAIPILATVVAEHSLRQSATTQKATNQTQLIITSVEKLHVGYVDAETGQRGYLLTGKPSYLVPYEMAKSSITANLRSLSDQLGDDETSLQDLAVVQNFGKMKLAELDQTIELARNGKKQAALVIVDSDVGKHYLDVVRANLNAIEFKRASRLQILRSRSAHEQLQTQWFLALGIAIDALLLVGTFQIMHRVSRRQAESYLELDAEKLKLQILLESIGDGVFVLDHNKKIVLFNPAATQITGYSAKEAVGKLYTDILQFSFEDDGRLNDEFIRTAYAGKVAAMANHTQLKHKHGRFVAVADSAAPYWTNDHKKVAGVVVVFRDVSHERKIEAAKDDFVSLASHQLRTPATAVKQFLGLILDGYSGDTSAMSKKQLDYIQQAYVSNDEQIKLVNSLLDIAKIEAGTVDFSPEFIDVSPIVQRVVERQQLLVDERKQHLKVHIPKTPVKALIDSNLLMSSLDNLINNAAKYTPIGGHIDVTVQHAGGKLIVSVADDGPGISQEGITQLFHRFTRLDTSTNGTGLGLYLVKLVCELHGGEVTGKSIVGKGATFSIIIPIGEQHV